jgi:hypothetical protein
MSANEGDTNTLVMAGLDPAIRQSSQRLLLEEDGLPGIGERKRRRPSDGYARQRRFDGIRAHARRDREAVSRKTATQPMIHRIQVLTSTDPDAISTAPGTSGLLALTWIGDDWIDPIERWAR